MSLINQSSDASALSAPKKYQHSGLRKDLKLHKAPETFDPLASGGLDDEDGFSVRPTFACTKVPHLGVRSQPLPAAKDLKRDHSRGNDVGTIRFLVTSYIL
jgi:hypothetical protein